MKPGARIEAAPTVIREAPRVVSNPDVKDGSAHVVLGLAAGLDMAFVVVLSGKRFVVGTVIWSCSG